LESNITDVGTEIGIGNQYESNSIDFGDRDGISKKSESKYPSQNNSESGTLSQISNCNALENNIRYVGTEIGIGNQYE
jgi:hypothetical protein